MNIKYVRDRAWYSLGGFHRSFPGFLAYTAGIIGLSVSSGINTGQGFEAKTDYPLDDNPTEYTETAVRNFDKYMKELESEKKALKDITYKTTFAELEGLDSRQTKNLEKEQDKRLETFNDRARLVVSTLLTNPDVTESQFGDYQKKLASLGIHQIPYGDYTIHLDDIKPETLRESQAGIDPNTYRDVFFAADEIESRMRHKSIPDVQRKHAALQSFAATLGGAGLIGLVSFITLANTAGNYHHRRYKPNPEDSKYQSKKRLKN